MNLNKRLLLGTLALILGLVILLAGRDTKEKIAVSLFLSPSQSEVKINGKKSKLTNNNTVTLDEGEYSFEFSHEGFENRKETLKLVEGMAEQKVSGALKPLTEEATKLLQEPHEVIAMEIANGAELAKPLEDAPMRKLSRLLPEIHRYYRIDFGVSPKRPGENLAIFIAANQPEYRRWALDWIRARGFDPSDFEFEFTSYEEPL